jgi:PAS domain S-box-containing protein
VARDISERKRAEEALRVSESRFRSLVENAHDIIFSIKPDGKFNYLSPQFEKYTGHSRKSFYGKSFRSLVHPDDFAKIVHAGARGATASFEFRLKDKNGEWRWFTSHITPIRDDADDILENIGIAHDMSETKRILQDLERTNQELRTTQSQLVQSEKMAALGNLVAGIAHEINTPIGAINSMHNTLIRAVSKLKKEMTEDCRAYPGIDGPMRIIDEANKVIQSGTERVANIVRRLRSFARLDEAELKDADIHEGLEDTLTLLHHEIKHGIKVVKNFGRIPRLDCFPGRLNQVFLNILINAKQAIGEAGTITITTYTENDKVHIEFEDTGVGISSENLSRIFDPGYTTKGVGVGTGLGLSICYQIINDHLGEILVQSQLGKGTKFTIVLPTDLDRRLNAAKESETDRPPAKDV